MGRTYADELHHVDLAIGFLERALAKNPEAPEALSRLAQIRDRIGQDGRAEVLLRAGGQERGTRRGRRAFAPGSMQQRPLSRGGRSAGAGPGRGARRRGRAAAPRWRSREDAADLAVRDRARASRWSAGCRPITSRGFGSPACSTRVKIPRPRSRRSRTSCSSRPTSSRRGGAPPSSRTGSARRMSRSTTSRTRS